MAVDNFMVLLCSLLVTSCSMLGTRHPEEPSGVNSSFQQPTSELIVLSNFQNAVRECNTENFMRCLADSSFGALRTFQFEASSEVFSTNAELFGRWNLQNERQAFYAMASKVNPLDLASLDLINARFEVRAPDSAVYVAEYILRVNHNSTTAPKVCAGSLRLTIAPNQLNQWSIERWVDAKSSLNDSIPSTWSTLKARFSN